MTDPLMDLVKSDFSRNQTFSLPPAVILAGGMGMRLRAAYAAGPKSMAPVAGRPFLDYLLMWLYSEGVEQVILCVGYKRSHIQRYVGKGSKWGLQATYSIEKELLGTGGAVKKAARLIPGNAMFVINGDSFLNVGLAEMLKFHRSRGALATMAAVKVQDNRRYGSLRMGRKGEITAFIEKRETNLNSNLQQDARPINGGVYIFERKLLSKIRGGPPISLEKEVFPQLVVNKTLYGFKKDAYFIDIGVPDDLRRAQIDLPERFRFSNPR